MNIRHILYINGITFIGMALAMLFPVVVDIYDGAESWTHFAQAAVVTAFVGLSFALVNRTPYTHLKTKDMFVLIASLWTLPPIFGALPFLWAEITPTHAGSIFEAVSSLTTTGITLIHNPEDLPRSVLLWRAILGWIGGISFIITAITLFPYLHINGMQAFQTHVTHAPRTFQKESHTAFYIFVIYFALTAICASLLRMSGMNPFDAICHAMATLSTSGISTYADSVGHFNNLPIELIITVFMILGSLPFTLYLRALRGDGLSVIKDTQVQVLLKILITFSLLLAAYIVAKHEEQPLTALRHAMFTVTSFVTTTGFSVENNVQWGTPVILLVFLMSIIGGCACSSSGGIKIFRFQILFETIKFQIEKLAVPDRVIQVHYNKKPIDAQTIGSVSVFFFIFTVSLFISSVLLMASGMDFVSAFSGALSTLSNTAHGLSGILGHDDTSPSQSALWYLSACMIIGRLEILPILVMLNKAFWRSA